MKYGKISDMMKRMQKKYPEATLEQHKEAILEAIRQVLINHQDRIKK